MSGNLEASSTGGVNPVVNHRVLDALGAGGVSASPGAARVSDITSLVTSGLIQKSVLLVQAPDEDTTKTNGVETEFVCCGRSHQSRVIRWAQDSGEQCHLRFHHASTIRTSQRDCAETLCTLSDAALHGWGSIINPYERLKMETVCKYDSHHWGRRSCVMS